MTPVDLKDIPAEVRSRLKLPKPARSRRGMSKDEIRSHAIRVLSAVAQLSQSDRARVLNHALRVNDV